MFGSHRDAPLMAGFECLPAGCNYDLTLEKNKTIICGIIVRNICVIERALTEEEEGMVMSMRKKSGVRRMLPL